jgi:hypothetical protein
MPNLTKHQAAMNPAALVLLFVLLLAFLGPAIDEAADHSAEWPTSTELQALQASQEGTARREAAGQALCIAERGPQSEARWTPEGHLVCTTSTHRVRNTITILEAKL